MNRKPRVPFSAPGLFLLALAGFGLLQAAFPEVAPMWANRQAEAKLPTGMPPADAPLADAQLADTQVADASPPESQQPAEANAAPLPPDNAPRATGPLSPEESLGHFFLAPGMAMELAACEPQVIDPVAIRFDDEGRMWVVEMRDYPHGPAPGEPPLSRIRILTDQDSDGFFETGVTFADGLLFATGLQPWQGGAIVTLAGRIAYLKDTNGDLVADHQETWFEDLAQDNPQLRANHPTLGPDGWVYVSNGLRARSVRDVRPRPGSSEVGLVADISGRDFRFDPTGTGLEAVSGHGQFGLSFDDFGNRFECSNRNPAMHVVLDDHYLRLNPHVLVAQVSHDVAIPGEQSKVFPLTRAWTTSTLHAHQFTAACGVQVFVGNSLGQELNGCCITCEPTGNLVHLEQRTPWGPTFSGKSPFEGRELVASDDEWFRPVNTEQGPDGCLYIVDMYRAVIEHPEFMPTELQTRKDLKYGNDRGRIYRLRLQVASADANRAAAAATEDKPGLASARPYSTMTVAELKAAFGTANHWERDTLCRLVRESLAASAPAQGRPILAANTARELLNAWQEQPTPEARARLLRLASTCGHLQEGDLLAATAETDARVRSVAVQLAEPALAESPALRDRVLSMCESEQNLGVQFRLALALGQLPADQAAPALGKLSLAACNATEPGGDWNALAIALAARQNAAGVLVDLVQKRGSGPLSPAAKTIIAQLALLVGRLAKPSDVAAVMLALSMAEEQAVSSDSTAGSLRQSWITYASLDAGLQSQGMTLAAVLHSADLASDSQLQASAAGTWASAQAAVMDPRSPADLAADAIRCLATANFDFAGETLLTLFASHARPELTLQVTESLSRFRDPRIAQALLESWPRQTPETRRASASVMLADSDRAAALVEAMTQGIVSPGELHPSQAEVLVRHANPIVADKARALLAAWVPADRTQVLADYQQALHMTGDADRGREIFRRNCTTCHKVAELGVDVGPDIADTRVKTPEQLLVDILQPNRAIDGNFVQYSVETTGGKVHLGILASETATSILLKLPEGKTLPLGRDEIANIASTGKSLMPDGLEKEINHQQMADLIHFLKHWRYLDGKTPLGQ